ncbi:hypothetical protein AC1031_016600 [Aphanomyces cochlioides]|nr:hypothetical protein AC1031_016600 [Aphanomyces cochlioides]
MSWWSDQDDLVLLTQVNNDRPFLSKTGVMKAWDEVAGKLAQVPDFGRTDLDGKKLANRFANLLAKYKDFQATSKYQSGIEEELTPKIVLLDELLELHEDAQTQKSKKQKSQLDEKSKKQDTAHHIREKAKQRLRSRLRDNESTPSDTATPQKRNYISDIHEKEIKLDEEKLAFKKLKLEKDSIEREKEREGRAKDREERHLDRELEQKRSMDMMHIMQILLEKINR